MWWPAGTHHVPHGGLRHRLASSGQWHARTAIGWFADEYDVDHQLQAAISSGTAVELMLKAYLVGVAPSLIVEKGSKDSLLMVSGRGDLASVPARDFRSIQGGEALTTARQIIGGSLHAPFPAVPQQPDSFVTRNGAAHMGLVDAERLRLAVVEMIRVIEALLPHMELGRERFWGTAALPVADALLDEANDAIRHTFEAKMAAAKRQVYRLTSTLSSPEAADQLLAALAARPHRSPPSEASVPSDCPVCDQVGELYFDLVEVPAPADDPFETAPTLYPLAFVCMACGLNLNHDELEIAGVPHGSN